MAENTAISQNEINKIPARDRVLGEIESIINEKDDSVRGERTDKFIKERVQELTTASKPRTLTFANRVGTVEAGFVHPDTVIQRQLFVDGLKVNDNDIYKVLIDSFRQFRNEPGWANKSLREIAQQAVARTIGVYFGNYTGTRNSEKLNRAFYNDHTTSDSDSVSISEIKGKGIAVCAEKGSTAENLLSFMGYDTELVMSTNNRLNFPDVDEEDGHLYLIVSSDKGRFIHDPTNPVVVSNPDGSFYNVLPSNYKITEEQYEGLKQGGQVEVKHTDLIWDGSEYKEKESAIRVYGGPKNVKI